MQHKSLSSMINAQKYNVILSEINWQIYRTFEMHEKKYIQLHTRCLLLVLLYDFFVTNITLK